MNNPFYPKVDLSLPESVVVEEKPSPVKKKKRSRTKRSRTKRSRTKRSRTKRSRTKRSRTKRK